MSHGLCAQGCASVLASAAAACGTFVGLLHTIDCAGSRRVKRHYAALVHWMSSLLSGSPAAALQMLQAMLALPPATRWFHCAGAITACGLACKPMAELQAIMNEMDFNHFLDKPVTPAPLRFALGLRNPSTWLTEKKGQMVAAANLSGKTGMFSTEPFEQWMSDTVTGHKTFATLVSPGNARGSSDHQPWHTKREVKVITSDLSEGRMRVLPDDLKTAYGVEYATFPIAEAARQSMSIPLFFEAALQGGRNGARYSIVDGGIMSNFPLWVRVGRFSCRPIRTLVSLLPYVTRCSPAPSQKASNACICLSLFGCCCAASTACLHKPCSRKTDWYTRIHCLHTCSHPARAQIFDSEYTDPGHTPVCPTVGFYLVDDDEDTAPVEEIDSAVDVPLKMLAALMGNADVAYQRSHPRVVSERVVRINIPKSATLPITSTKFDLTDDDKDRLWLAGWTAASTFLRRFKWHDQMVARGFAAQGSAGAAQVSAPVAATVRH